MPNPIIPLPDDELALLQYLKGVPELLALIPAANIRTELPSKPTYPMILIARAGGDAHDRGSIDEPAIQTDVEGGDKRTCKRIAQTVRAAILAIANDIVDEGVLVSASEEVGLTWLPDTIPTPPIPRYTMRHRILLHK